MLTLLNMLFPQPGMLSRLTSHAHELSISIVKTYCPTTDVSSVNLINHPARAVSSFLLLVFVNVDYGFPIDKVKR